MKSPRRLLAGLVALCGTFLVTQATPSHAGVFDLALKGMQHQVSAHMPRQEAAPVALPEGGSFASCSNLFPKGQAIAASQLDRQWKATELCSKHFAVLYSGLTKTPLLVVERLDRQQLAAALESQRTNEFYADPRLKPGARAELDDFTGTGLDRGHMAPAGDQPDQDAMAQSFALSNIVPQDSFNNRKVWKKIEADARKFARRAQGDVYLFTGPIFRGAPGAIRTIGHNKVWVPTHLFKLVYDEASGRSWAHILENTSTARVGAPISYEEFVKQAGWAPLPAGPAGNMAAARP